jgi:hypothetical protein
MTIRKTGFIFITDRNIFCHVTDKPIVLLLISMLLYSNLIFTPAAVKQLLRSVHIRNGCI